MIIKIATHLADMIGGQVSLSRREQVALRFGFQILLGESFKLAVFLGTAYYLGVMPQVLTIALTAALLKVISGGAHCSTFLNCLIICTVFFCGLGLGVQWLEGVLPHLCLLGVILIAYMMSWWVTDCWVPADSPNRPITTVEEGIRFKRLSFVFIHIWFGVMILLWGSCFVYPVFDFLDRFILAMTAGVLWQILHVTPLGYRFIEICDKALSFIQYQLKGGEIHENV